MGDYYGRRPLLIAHSSLFIPSALLSGLAQNFTQLLVMRFIVGLSIGRELPRISLHSLTMTMFVWGGSLIIFDAPDAQWRYQLLWLWWLN